MKLRLLHSHRSIGLILVLVTLLSSGLVLSAGSHANLGVIAPANAVSALSIVPIGEAVDNYALTFSTGGNVAWYGQTTTSYYGGDAAQSGDIGDNQYSWLFTKV